MNPARRLRTDIVLRAEEPPNGHKNRQPAPDQTRVVHRPRGRREEEREAVNHKPDDHVRAADGVDDEAERATHVEGAGDDVLAPGEEMGQDGGGVGGGGE